MIAHGLVDFFISPLLLFAQRWGGLKYAAQVGKTVDFLFINLEYASFHGFVKHSTAYARTLQQVLLAHLAHFATL